MIDLKREQMERMCRLEIVSDENPMRGNNERGQRYEREVCLRRW
jgi:hypothetical protein